MADDENIMEEGDRGFTAIALPTQQEEDFVNANIVYLGQKGLMKITPVAQIQSYTRSTIAYIANGIPAPVVQVVPITDVNITPHQISFNFFDTSEGKIGVANPLEKHLQLECDIYVSDLIFGLWNHGVPGSVNSIARELLHERNVLLDNLDETNYLNFTKKLDVDLNTTGLQQLEDTVEFITFRQNFLQQFSGYYCTFTSDVFGTFDGVLTEVKYELGGGEVDSKFHIKIEEAIFTDDYSVTGATDGKSESSEPSAGSESGSGDVST